MHCNSFFFFSCSLKLPRHPQSRYMQVHQSSHFFMYVSFWVRAGCSIDALSLPTFISRFYFPALSHFLNDFDVSTVFCSFFFFFFLIWEKVFWEFEKKKWPSQDRVWERQKKAIGAFIRLFIFSPSFSLRQEDKIVLAKWLFN